MTQTKRYAGRTKARVLSHLKPKMVYDVETFKRCNSAVLRPITDGNKSFVYVKQRNMENVRKAIAILRKQNPGVDYVMVDDKDVRLLINQYQLVGFNNDEFDDYMLQAMLDGKSTMEVYEMAQLVIEHHVRLWTKGYKALFGTFDLRSVLPMNISLKQAAAEAGYRVWEFDDVPWDYDEEFSVDLLVKMLGYDDHDTWVTGRLFVHEVVYSAYKQHVAFIDQYLPGCDWLISKRDASLAEEAITERGKIKIERKKKFDWILNGHNVLAEIPVQWRNEYYRYSKDLEVAFDKWEDLVANGMNRKEAYDQTMSLVTLPQVETVWLDEFFGLAPSAGGIHSVTANHPEYKPEGSNAIRAKDVDHFDIGGAYGATARQKRVYGAAQERYNRFMDDKFRYKNAAKAIKKNKGLAIPKIKAGVKQYFGIELEGNDMESIIAEISGGVDASKLGTNSPTGKADSPTSSLYNPIGMIEVRLILQCLFYDILKKLIDAGCVALSANTDGFFLVRRGVDVTPFIKAWEEKWALELDYDHVDEYIGKDDNNRVLVVDGKVEEAAGDDVCHQEFNPRKSSKLPRIVDNVVLRKIVDPGLDIRELLKEYVAANRVDLFMWVLKATKGHVGVVNYQVSQKINRILLTTDGDQVGNYSIVKDKVETFANFPVGTPVAVINGDLPEVLPDNLNLDVYASLCEKVYSRWI